MGSGTNYDAGDEIFLFGFSRGAYTARSLAGMLHKCGLVKRAPCARLAQATPPLRGASRPLTCQEANQPLCSACLENRERIVQMQQAYQDQKEEKRENVGKEASQQENEAWQALHALRAEYAVPVTIKIVGVWDTVGALGIPPLFSLMPNAARRRDYYGFLDTSIDKDVEYAYQALALDERRKLFTPAVWTARQSPARAVDANGEPTLRQVWFAGVHSNVGGGYDDAGQAGISLGWMMCWAQKRGLRFQLPYQRRLFPDRFGELRDSIDTLFGKFVYHASPRFPRLAASGYPDELPLIHCSVFDKRRRGMLPYLPLLPSEWCEGVNYRLCTDEIEPTVTAHT